jgi:hypothetical protein
MYSDSYAFLRRTKPSPAKPRPKRASELGTGTDAVMSKPLRRTKAPPIPSASATSSVISNDRIPAAELVNVPKPLFMKLDVGSLNRSQVISTLLPVPIIGLNVLVISVAHEGAPSKRSEEKNRISYWLFASRPLIVRIIGPTLFSYAKSL